MESVDLEIQTLLSSKLGLQNDSLVQTVNQSILQDNDDHGWEAVWNLKGKQQSGSNLLLRRVENVVWREWFCRNRNLSESEESTSSTEDVDENQQDFHDGEECTVNGSDIGDLPANYTVRGLMSHEVPVIGTYVDKTIVTGFKYVVRMLGSGRTLFGGEPQVLERIGMGYGKRLTFRGDSLNYNDNIFWSDSLPDGYGFAIHVLDAGTKFEVCDEEDRYIGTALVESVDSQQIEVFSHSQNGAVEKHVRVGFSCFVHYGAMAHGLMSLRSEELIQLSGLAVVTRAKRGDTAVIKCIVDISLPYLGACTFYPEEFN